MDTRARAIQDHGENRTHGNRSQSDTLAYALERETDHAYHDQYTGMIVPIVQV